MTDFCERAGFQCSDYFSGHDRSGFSFNVLQSTRSVTKWLRCGRDVGARISLQVGDKCNDLLSSRGPSRTALLHDFRSAICAAWSRAICSAFAISSSEYGVPSRARTVSLLGRLSRRASFTQKPWIRWHHRIRAGRAWILHVPHVPEMRVFTADAQQIRTRPFRSPEERALVDRLSRFLVFAVSLELVTERPHGL
jgi:hypothetical protein